MLLAALVSEKQLFYQYMYSQDQNQSLHSYHYFAIIANGTALNWESFTVRYIHVSQM